MTTAWYGETSTVAPAPRTLSPLAVGDGLRRAARRTLPVYGVCVHTTGSGPATQARATARSPLQVALDYYVHGREGFPHYLIGRDGTIHTICDEAYVAWHAGWATRGGKSRWSDWTAPAWWSSVWQRWNARTPAGLLPRGAQSPNSVYVGVELLADASGWGFTDAQYGALARLVADVFRRHAIPLTEPPNPRLLGHEDVEPIERANAQGGWDPGAHRAIPKFSWSRLWSLIQGLGAGGAAPAPGQAAVPVPAGDGVSAFAGFVRNALAASGSLVGSVVGVAEAVAAFAAGERNANRLADVLFHARHRERGGRPIASAETQLAQEWRWLRANVVIAALRRIGAPQPVVARAPSAPEPPAVPAIAAIPAAAFTRSVPAARRWAALLPLLERYRGEIPLDFLLGWIAVESDGRIDVVTSLDERGFFQVHPAESKDARPPLQHHRLSTDPDYSVQAGLQLVRYYAQLARARFPWIPAGSELFWRIVKLQHAMGSGLARGLLNRMRARGIATTWENIKRFEVTDGPRLHPLLAREPGRFGRNVDRVFERGLAVARSLGR
jgi:N-acetylmuramoyl-L-alanine amidase